MHVERDISHNQTIAVAQGTVAADESIVNERAVLAAQVAHADVSMQLIDQDFAMMAADELFWQSDMAVGCTPDQEFGFNQKILRRFNNVRIAIDAIGPLENDLHVFFPSARLEAV